MNEHRPQRQIIVVGDVHGQYDPFVHILRHAGLVDGQLNWSGGRNRLVQMGDIFDRGPHPRQVDDLLDKLQKQANAEQGEVIRLVGNHELELLMSNFLISGFGKQEAKLVRDKLKRQVLDFEIRAAYAYKGFLFTHAGVTHKLMKIFKIQLDELNENNVAILTNMIFREAIKHEFFRHPIFNISIHRSGTDRFGGIFWEDLDDLLASCPRSELRQVVGHTQVPEIVLDNGRNIIPVDVGLHRKMQYLNIVGEHARAVTVQ
ncbi:metallophosphoesterase [Candidatus Avelusimicrobium facis]|uniref:metallophosphoesterase n=1 Tax=Candidatus Avelusimicrobium facis TaxID=3416203 RepID=UPI0015B6C85B